MRTLLPALALTLGLTTPFAFSAELTLPLTPDTLEHWTLDGAAPEELKGEPLTLPAGAQVSRLFTTDTLAVRLTSSPVFARDPADWPVLELGSAALVFARDEGTGYLALALGAEKVVLHPHTIFLNDEGQAKEPITATLRWQGQTVSLETNGQRIDLTAPAQTSLGIAASSGHNQAWSLDLLAVTLHVSDEDLPEALRNSGDHEAAARAVGAVATSRSTTNPDDAFPSSEAATRSTRAEPPPGYRPLEVYTPPSVRTQRTEQIKATIKTLRNQ